MARLTLALLGPLRVLLDGQPVANFGYDKVRALLAYLAVEGKQPHDRSSLAGLLWPGETDAVARKNLRTALAILRQAIGDATAQPRLLLVTRNTIQFNPASDHELDVGRFATLLREAEQHRHPDALLCDICVDRLGCAVDLYHGDFLQQVSVPGSVAWEEWALVTRERLHGQMLDALAQLCTYHELQGADDLARAYAWRMLMLEEWNESAHRCLMRVFARAGQRAVALAQYERCRHVLSAELGLTPADETTALYARILSGDACVREGAAAMHAQPLLPETVSVHPPPAAPSTAVPLVTDRAPVLSPGLDAAATLHSAVGPLSSVPPSANRNRARMLAKVRRCWIDGVLRESLHGGALIALGLVYDPTATERTWKGSLHLPDQAERRIAPGTPLGEVYDAFDGAMLILGAPGAGKTITLLELTCELLDRADQNSDLPIPVVFNLSSWAAQRRSLADWLVDELNLRYQVPRKIGLAWIDAAQIVPLLDGLDEVASEHRSACVEAINTFRTCHWLIDTVVCCRTADYQALAVQLQLHGAVRIQPLAPEQSDAYLLQGGDTLTAVRELLHADSALRDMIDTPLMLDIMVLAYRGRPVDTSYARMPQSERRRHLFDTYVQCMFDRRAPSAQITPCQAVTWLAWLARAMQKHSQSIFFIEGLQPSWLESRNSQRWYAAGSMLAVNAVVGLLALLANLLSLIVRNGLGRALDRFSLLLLVITGTVVCSSGLGMLLHTVRTKLPQRRWCHLALYIAGLGVCFGLIYGSAGWVVVGRDESLPVFVGLGIAGITVGLLTRPEQIKGIEYYRWSWIKARSRWPLIGIYGLLVGLIYTLVDGSPTGVVFALASTIVPGLVFGLTTSEVETHTRPNQGIWWSARNAAEIGALCGGLGFLLVTLLVSRFEGTVEGLAKGGGTATVGVLLGGLVAGGFACLQHGVLRILLWYAGATPWNYAYFLDHATTLLLVRKVGGGYMFAHRLLLDHFAGLDAAYSVQSAPGASAPGLPGHTIEREGPSSDCREDLTNR